MCIMDGLCESIKNLRILEKYLVYTHRFSMTKGNRKKTHNISELEYRRKWLCQLQVEFRQICSWYRVSLAVPAFRISESRTMLGSWNPDTRTISISSFLINQYSWDVVINVLKHEMAHQYVHECLNMGMEQPHGEHFRQACEKLGVLSPFNRATGDTPKLFTADQGQGGSSDYDGKVRKVRKMLSLAASANRHEAAAAMSKANSFIRKYNLERLEAGEPSSYSYEIINTRKKRLQAVERRIASLLMDYFYVDIVYSELFDPGSTLSYKTIELLGTAENVAVASHVYYFLNRRVESLWHNFRKVQKVPGRLRKTYIMGLLQGFREKLAKEEQRHQLPAGFAAGKQRHRTISALVIAKDAGLETFTARRFPRLRKVHYRAAGIYCGATYSAGKTEGRNITIHKTIKSEDGNRGRLLRG